MVYEKFLYIGKREAAEIQKALNWKEGDSSDFRLGEEDTIINTVGFDNGFDMDIKCCGVKYLENEDNSAWTQAILYDTNGYEVGCSEVEAEYFGTWELDDGDGNIYRVFVRRSKSKFDYNAFEGDLFPIAVSKEKYTIDEAIEIAKRELNAEDEESLTVKNAYVRFRAGIDEDGERRVCWWLEDTEYATSCPVWEFYVI